MLGLRDSFLQHFSYCKQEDFFFKYVYIKYVITLVFSQIIILSVNSSLCPLIRILQVAVYSCESQAPFQSGVQRRSHYPPGKHTVGAHPQTSALYLLLLHNRRKVQWAKQENRNICTGCDKKDAPKRLPASICRTMMIVWRTVLEKLVHASPKKEDSAAIFTFWESKLKQ